LILPVVILTTREAMRAVPQEIRDGSLALGATEVQTVVKQTLPAAVPGIATGTILAVSRAIGEAAPLLLLGALVFITYDPNGLLRRIHHNADSDFQLDQCGARRVQASCCRCKHAAAFDSFEYERSSNLHSK
jgi:ABC-type phosphate transport system permease subunit